MTHNHFLLWEFSPTSVTLRNRKASSQQKLGPTYTTPFSKSITFILFELSSKGYSYLYKFGTQVATGLQFEVTFARSSIAIFFQIAGFILTRSAQSRRENWTRRAQGSFPLRVQFVITQISTACSAEMR